MPYPEMCPECSSTFRNTGTHFTARRNEVGRHVLLELGCQTTNRRFWWDFTTGQPAGEAGSPSAESKATSTSEPRLLATAATNGAGASTGRQGTTRTNGSQIHTPSSSNGHTVLATVPLAQPSTSEETQAVQSTATPVRTTPAAAPAAQPEPAPEDTTSLREAFLRQLQLDRLTMRQMRSWLMVDEARRAAEVAASATEGTYERLALALFGVDLPQLLGRATTVPPSTAMSAEERLELQREKARIRARQRRAALKAARLAKGED
jgi:hypothetical protein